jgi:hypothetical protein
MAVHGMVERDNFFFFLICGTRDLAMPNLGGEERT